MLGISKVFRRIEVEFPYLILLILAIICPGSAIFAEDKNVTPEQQAKVTWPILSQSQIDSLVDSLRSGKMYNIPPIYQDDPVDVHIKGFWAGSRTEVKSSIDNITLHFKLTPESLRAGDVSSPLALDNPTDFDLVVYRDQFYLYFLHSSAFSSQDRTGVKMSILPKFNDPDARVPFMRGVGDTGLYVVVPRLNPNAAEWRVLVCPRRISRSGRKDDYYKELKLEQSPYTLTDVSLELSAKAEGALATAGQKGHIAVTMRTTENIPAAVDYIDQQSTTIPRAELEYHPAEAPQRFPFPEGGSMAEGIVTSVLMENQSGYFRRQNFARVGYVHKIAESRSGLVALGKKVVSDSGDCYIIATAPFEWTQYGKHDEEGEAK